MRILLISPTNTVSGVTAHWLRMPQLALPILAALTPPEHDVVMVEEEYEPLPADEHFDVVGITSMTATAQRAYDLATFFKRRGAKVVLGGIHASVMPDEAAQFADSVVVGEAEGVWPEVLHHAQHNRLHRFYRNPRPDISQSPLPVRNRRQRWLVGRPPYLMPIMASRGCPYDCEFCCVHRVYGRGQRHVPIERIVADIRRNRPRVVMFLDDNIGGDRPYAMRLFEAIRPLRIVWVGQSSVRFIRDEALFKSAVRSGCQALFVGVESLEAAARKTMRKSLSSVGDYEDAIRRCRDAGVIFHASLIFGLDEQTPRVFDHTLDFLERNAVYSISPNILTPYPGTRLFDRLEREQRILHTNWSFYDHTTVCYQPKNMTPEELAARYIDFRRRFFSYASVLRRMPANLRTHPLMFLGMNLAFHHATGGMEARFARYLHWLREGVHTPAPKYTHVPAWRSALRSIGLSRSPVRAAD